MHELPRGTVTFLFTDIEGSTRLLQELGEDYAEALAEHRRVLRDAFERHGGVEVDRQGDAFFVAFERATDALAAATAGRDALEGGPIQVRMGIHTGEPVVTDEGYVGLDVHRAARICSTAHGGQVVLSESTLVVLDGDFPLEDLGLHRLKDLAEPVKLFQVGSGDFPPLRSLNATNLPTQPTPLVGRERELAEVLELLGSAPVVTLTGAAGSGKTRLALQAAAQLVDEFKDGVFWVSLAALTDPVLVLPTVAATVGAKDELAQFVDERRMLLLLDNLEQVLGCAPALAELLRSCPNLKLLVTSRAPLRINGEQEYEVPPLPEAEAVELFTQRARRVKPGFDSDEDVAEICRRLDGLPLALELAAARIKLLSSQEILKRLEHRFELLVGGVRDGPGRQQTLRATIEWSHDLLEETEKKLFARLAVFAGSFDFEAAEQIGSGDVDTLEALIDKSLLRETHERRFFMLETIREYATERLNESGEIDGLSGRLADFYLARVELLEPELFGLEQRRILDDLEADFDNLRAVIDWALEHGKADLVLRLTGALDLFWHALGHMAEARRWFGAALGAGAQYASPRARAKALYSLASIVVLDGDYVQAQRLAGESLALLQDLPESWELSYALAVQAEVAAAQGNLEQARELAEDATRVARHVGDWYRTIVALDRLASVASLEGDTSEARRLGDEAVTIAREAKQPRPIARSLGNLAWFALVEGDHEEAVKLCEEGLGLIHGTNDPKVAFELSHTLGVARLGLGDRRGGREAAQQALALARSMGLNEYVRAGLDALAAAAGADDHPRRAALLLGTADGLRGPTGDTWTQQEEAVYAEHLRRAQRSLSEEEWLELRERGRRKSLDEAIEYALGSID